MDGSVKEGNEGWMDGYVKGWVGGEWEVGRVSE
jgi:hypothetical protein